MRAFHVVMSRVLADEFTQVYLTQRDDAVEALLLDRADEALDESVQVWAATRQANRFRSGVTEHAPNTGSEDRITIHDEVSFPYQESINLSLPETPSAL